MRDIAETLAFIAYKVLTDADPDTNEKSIRKEFADAFEELLNNLPEGWADE